MDAQYEVYLLLICLFFLLNYVNFSCRGVSYQFGHDVVLDFLEKHNFDLICRAHQVVEDGYEFQADRQLVTIFSAPNYCGEFDNAGGMMVVKAGLVCSFKVLRPLSHKPLLRDVSNRKLNNNAGPNNAVPTNS